MFLTGDCLFGEAASASRLKKDGGRYRILHFATHGIYDSANPMYSGIMLAPGEHEDGFWSAREIASTELNVDLVVMSACETARGQVTPGEGILGLSWALFVAGNRSSVLGQWKVDDTGTAELMTEFYGGIRLSIANGSTSLGLATALQAAQRKLAAEKQWAHPYYWSSFVLVGDWR